MATLSTVNSGTKAAAVTEAQFVPANSRRTRLIAENTDGTNTVTIGGTGLASGDGFVLAVNRGTTFNIDGPSAKQEHFFISSAGTPSVAYVEHLD